MARFQRSWQLVKASWSVLRADKELLVLPVLSMLATMVTIALFVAPMFLTARVHTVTDSMTGAESSSLSMSPVGYVLAVLLYASLAYITVFFNTALITAADERMRGGNPTLDSAIKGATTRAGKILPWALLSGVVSAILRSLEQRAGVLGRIAVGMVGIAWSLVTFLVLPIIVIEGLGVGDALKRSADLFKRTWGENVIANAAMNALGFVAVLVAVPFVLLAVVTGVGPAIVAAIAVAVVWVLGVSIVLSALGVVYQVALYRYATDGAAPPAFAAIDLGSAFAPKAGGIFKR